jgi:protein arginine N-methyltransferase 3
MLDSVLVARDRWLAPGGILVPNNSRILLTAVQDDEWMNDRYSYWEDVYGFKMKTLKKSFTEEAQVDVLSKTSPISTSAVLKVSVNFESVDVCNLTAN